MSKASASEAYRISGETDFYVVRHALSSKMVPEPTHQNLVVLLDCSGSMGGDIRLAGQQLKNKVATLLRPGDTVSVIWFSGRGEAGVLLEFMGLEHLKDLQRINAAIDRWLRPVGLTGFVEPLQLARNLAVKYDNGNPWHMLFMSDGMDNQWERGAILEQFDKAREVFAGVTIVEYGYYADRAFLAKMAERCNGEHIIAKDLDAFIPEVSRAFESAPQAKQVTVELTAEPVMGFVWTLGSGSEITMHRVVDGKVSVPEGRRAVWFLTEQEQRDQDSPRLKAEFTSALYIAAGLFAVRVRPQIVRALLQTTGDVRLIRAFGNCYGKQAYTNVQSECLRAGHDPAQRGLGGIDRSTTTDPDAWSVLETLRLIASDEHNRVLLDDPAFRYARIGRAKVASKDALVFTDNAFAAAAGYEVSRLVFNEDRPNISIGVSKPGTIALPKERPKNLPEELSTSRQKNYSIIRDGLLNVERLPVLVTTSTLETLCEKGLFADGGPKLTWESTANIDGEPVFRAVLDLEKLPLVNRSTVEKLADIATVEQLFRDHYETWKLRAAQKVYGYYYGAWVVAVKGATRTSEGLETLFGQESAAWLKQRGVTDQGFTPPSEDGVTKDFYMGQTLKIALAGLGSLPPVKDVLERRTKDGEAKKKAEGDAKLTAKLKPPPISHRIMLPFIAEVEKTLEAEKRSKVLAAWVDAKHVVARNETRKRIAANAQRTIGVLLGQVWFGRDDLEPIVQEIDTPDGTIECTASLADIRIDL